ncbi:MAG TPA: TadE/TadG family type IV pilus assembly protein [Gemmataceae bacterium]|jgi:Flp pilus assembly protein TadG
MPNIRKPSRSERRGAAVVEFAFVLPIMLSLLVGIWEVGRMIEVQQVLTNAAREGARQAATGEYTNSQVKSIVTQYITVAGLPSTNVTVNVSDLTNPGTDVSKASYLDNLQVQASIPYKDIGWSFLNFFTTSSTQISTTVQWVTMIDQAYPSEPEPPVG